MEPNQSQSLSSVSSNELKELTPKNRLFLQLMAEGKPTVEAYREAGYLGNEHAAYEMRSYLGKELERMLASRGLDKSNLMSAFKELIDIPLNEHEKTRGVTIKQRLAVLKEWSKILPAEGKEDRPKITPFILNINASIPIQSAEEVTNVEQPIDGEVVQPLTSDSQVPANLPD